MAITVRRESIVRRVASVYLCEEHQRARERNLRQAVLPPVFHYEIVKQLFFAREASGPASSNDSRSGREAVGISLANATENGSNAQAGTRMSVLISRERFLSVCIELQRLLGSLADPATGRSTGGRAERGMAPDPPLHESWESGPSNQPRTGNETLGAKRGGVTTDTRRREFTPLDKTLPRSERTG